MKYSIILCECKVTMICLKEANYPIAGQVEGKAKLKERWEEGQSLGGLEQTNREARCACHTEKRYQVTWQSVDKKNGLI